VKKTLLGGLAALTVAAAATIGLASPAMAYEVPAGHHIGQYTGTNSAGTVTNVDMNVQLDDGSQWYHEFDLTYTPGADGTITFDGVGKQFDNDGEKISGVIDTINRTLTYTANYYTNGAPDGRSWSVYNAHLDGSATSGDIDWSGTYLDGQYKLLGGLHNVPNFAPAPVTGNHGQYVSGASHAGIKGKALAEIAKDNTLIGPYKG